MDNFKQPKKKISNSRALDGFIVSRDESEPSSETISRRFRRSYYPHEKPGDREFISRDHTEPDGFYQRRHAQPDTLSYAESNQHQSDLEVNLDFQEPQQKRRFGIFKRSSSKKPKRSFGKRAARVVGVFSIILVLSVGSLLGYAYLKARQVFRGNGDGAAALQENVDPAKLNGEGDGRVNILLLGKGGPGHEAPDLTDTILLASIDPLQHEVSLVSVPRDLYVEDANGYSTKINAIYSNAKQNKLSSGNASSADIQVAEDVGLRAIKEQVSEVLGVPVHYYAMVNFTAFKEAIDTVGGITIDIKEPLSDATMAWLNGGNPVLAAEGLQTFDGNRALLYARSRHGSARGDFDRTERQREVIVALQQKILTLGTFSNPFKIVELLNTLGDNVRTDLNGTGELKRLYEIGQGVSSDKVTSIGLADPPNVLVTTGMVGNQSVVMPSAGLNQYEEIQSYIRNIMRDPYLKREDARIVILNGTTTVGLATAKEKELKSFGYNVVSVDNAPSADYTTTQIIDLTSGQKPYSLSYLQKRLGISGTSPGAEGLPTTETADFVIILGSNETTKTTNNR